MLTGELRSKIDGVWNAFWAGGIANPLEVIEQITYLLFMRGLDEVHTREENKANRLGNKARLVLIEIIHQEVQPRFAANPLASDEQGSRITTGCDVSVRGCSDPHAATCTGYSASSSGVSHPS